LASDHPRAHLNPHAANVPSRVRRETRWIFNNNVCSSGSSSSERNNQLLGATHLSLDGRFIRHNPLAIFLGRQVQRLNPSLLLLVARPGLRLVRAAKARNPE
jgi:hypothetical protein